MAQLTRHGADIAGDCTADEELEALKRSFRLLCSSPPPRRSSRLPSPALGRRRLLRSASHTSTRGDHGAPRRSHEEQLGEEREATKARRELALTLRSARAPGVVGRGCASRQGGSRGRLGVGGWRRHAPRREARQKRRSARPPRCCSAILMSESRYRAERWWLRSEIEE